VPGAVAALPRGSADRRARCRLRGRGIQDWLPRSAAEPQPNAWGKEPEFRSQKPEWNGRSCSAASFAYYAPHGIIHKPPHTHRYQVSDDSRLLLNAVLSAQRTTTQQLTNHAA
jgi:hypothetical protein